MTSNGAPASIKVRPTAALTGLHVSGNSLLDGNNNPVRFRGVNRSGSEYACIQGWGVFDGPSDATSVAAIASWHVNAVRVPLNEDCWLNINMGSSAYGGATYQNAIVAFVNLLNANGIYAEISLIWGAPGTTAATNQPAAPDEDHSPAFWTSVATTFKSNPNVVFGVWGETTVSWTCFLNGCSNEAGYTTAGTQQLVNNIRATGATQVISVPCITYANDCYDDSTHNWLTYEPTDSLHSLIAEAHIYGNNTCGAQNGGACLTNTIAPIAAQVPFFFGETGETYDDSECTSNNMQVILPWADSHNVGYLAWTWDTWGNCDALISDYAGTPNTTAPGGALYGKYVHDHLATISPPPSCVGAPLFTSYFNWYDNASYGMLGDNIHLLNTGVSPSVGCISVGAQSIPFTLAAGSEQYLKFPAGTIGGPVVINVLSGPAVQASQRVQYFQSFNEVWALSASQAATTSYINWYDRASTGMLADNIHILNPGVSTASVQIKLAGQTTINLSVSAGQEQYTNFPAGTIGGPVTVSSSVPVLASARVQYYQTFNEAIAHSPTEAATTSYFNWFDKASYGMVGDNIHVVNPGLSSAHVTLSLPGQSDVMLTVPANGGEQYGFFPAGAIGGPVKVTSDLPVLASQRVQYFQSFNEVAAAQAGQALATSHVMWFDKASYGMVGDNIHVLNTSALTAHVSVSVPGGSTQNLTLAPGVEGYVTFAAGVIGGPVTITSDQPVLAAQRVQYFSSFNEVPTR